MTTTTPQRIGGWLLGPLAWLLVALLSTTLALLLYTDTNCPGTAAAAIWAVCSQMLYTPAAIQLWYTTVTRSLYFSDIVMSPSLSMEINGQAPD